MGNKMKQDYLETFNSNNFATFGTMSIENSFITILFCNNKINS